MHNYSGTAKEKSSSSTQRPLVTYQYFTVY
jgi:hypothetical protein